MHMLRHILGWGEGWGLLTFMLTCVTCTCYVTSWVWGRMVCVNVDVNLRHTHMLRHVLSLGEGWGVLTFMLTCVTCTCYVTSWVWGGWCVLTFMLTCVTRTGYVTSWVWGVGCVNVHVNLRHMHMLRHVWVSPYWHHNCRMRTDVDTGVKQEQDLVTCRH